jgi:hypothetical protein
VAERRTEPSEAVLNGAAAQVTRAGGENAKPHGHVLAFCIDRGPVARACQPRAHAGDRPAEETQRRDDSTLDALHLAFNCANGQIREILLYRAALALARYEVCARVADTL